MLYHQYTIQSSTWTAWHRSPKGAPAARRRRAQGRRPGRRLRRPLPRPLALASADAEPGMEKLGKLQGKPWKNHGMEKPWKKHRKTKEKP